MNTLYTKKSKKKYGVSFIVVLITVVLCSCLLIGTVAAWLTRTYEFSDSDNQIGSVDIKLYSGNQEITGTITEDEQTGLTRWSCNTPYVINGGQLTRNNIGLNIRNMGTVDALVRATIIIFYLQDGNDGVASSVDNPSNRRVADITANTPTLAGSIQLTTNNWVRDFPVDTVAAGEMFCSTTVEPYISRTPNADGTGVEETIVSENSLTIIDSLTVSSSQQNASFYVFVTIDAVAYDGNIYKKIENGETSATDIPVQALPFGKKDTLPESWEAWK